MHLPNINISRPHKKQRILAFRGLNLSESFSDGEMTVCEGVTTEKFPIITQRKGIEKSAEFTSVSAAAYHGARIIINSGRIYVDGEDIGAASDGDKKFVAMGKRILIFPDKLCVYTDVKKIEKLQADITGDATFTASEIVFEEGTDLSEFQKGDAVRISGSLANDKTAIIRNVSENVLTFDEDSLTAGENPERIMLLRFIPDFDCVCESNNRIWGASKDTIYASALGDPKNYEVYDGLSTDSYTVAVASPGRFTACCAYGSKILFFKENEIYTIYGTKPANYQISKITVPGVESGAHKTLKAINEILYYKAKDGVYAYNGDLPQKISDKLGTEKYEAYAAGADGTAYFISMNGKIYCYDTVRRIWTVFCKKRADWFIDNGFVSGGALYETGTDTEKVEWECEFTPFTEYIENRKCFSRIYIRYRLDKGAYFEAFCSSDGAPYKSAGTVYDALRKTATVTIYPNRCDKFRIKLCGAGKCEIESITREFYLGSEV